MPTAKTTANMMKMARQENAPKMMPEAVGPMAGANMMMRAAKPIAAPSFCGAKTSMETANIMGSSKPVPMPWTKRPIKTMAKLGAAALMIEPTKKLPSAKSVSLRTENHFIRMPAKGIMRPMTSM